jgi:hypothetical protein
LTGKPEPLAEIDGWLRPYRRLWSDALEHHLDTMPDPVPDPAEDS